MYQSEKRGIEAQRKLEIMASYPRILMLVFCSALFMQATGFASATTMSVQKFTCPVGGEEFEEYAVGSFTTFGSRPDGKPYGTVDEFPIVICPNNHFPIFDNEFTKEETDHLEALLSSNEYLKLVKKEPSYFRAWWLAEKIGRADIEQANLLLQASWQYDGDLENSANPARKRQVQEQFIELVSRFNLSGLANLDAFWLKLRQVNALRELERFEEARRELNELLQPQYWPADQTELDSIAFAIKGLFDLILEKNNQSEAVNMMPEEMAYFHCKDNPNQTGLAKATCQRVAEQSYRYEPNYDYAELCQPATPENTDKNAEKGNADQQSKEDVIEAEVAAIAEQARQAACEAQGDAATAM